MIYLSWSIAIDLLGTLVLLCCEWYLYVWTPRLKKRLQHKESSQRSQRSSTHFQRFMCIVVSSSLGWINGNKPVFISQKHLAVHDKRSQQLIYQHGRFKPLTVIVVLPQHVTSVTEYSVYLHPASIRRQRPTQHKCIYSPLVVKNTHKQSTLQSE